jgi:putative transposase
MDLPVRKKLPYTVPQWVADGSWFFITIKCTPPETNQLCRVDIGDGILAAMAHNHEKLIWHCRLCLLMPNHLHTVIAFPREQDMQTLISNWKKFVALKFGVKWQRDFFDHRLRDHHELDEKNQLNPDEPSPQRIVRASRRLGLDLSSSRPATTFAGLGRARQSEF